MPEEYNVYCDESCHLEFDRSDSMALGAVWLPTSIAKDVNDDIRHIKKKHGIPPHLELKWTKVSPAQAEAYRALLDYFFKHEQLAFRGLVARGKRKLEHSLFRQDHDDWYYKMYYQMLYNILGEEHSSNIYVDMKDTQGSRKLRTLHEYLCRKLGDKSKDVVKRIQIVRSHEIQILQLTDILIGALSYHERGLQGSKAKLSLIETIKQESGHTLQFSSFPRDRKFNVFYWHPQEM